ncbi:hypothetical protein V1511DRAFT_395708 [Dipodascopsis uninucleata]
MNTASDTMICAVSLLEFLIKVRVLKECWGPYCTLQQNSNGQNSTFNNTAASHHFITTPVIGSEQVQVEKPREELKPLTTIGNSSFTFLTPREALRFFAQPISKVLFVGPHDMTGISYLIGNDWENKFIEIENFNITISNYNKELAEMTINDQLNKTKSNVTENFISEAKKTVDITPLVRTFEHILYTTRKECENLRALYSGNYSKVSFNGAEKLYQKADDLHSQLNILQEDNIRTIILGGTRIQTSALVKTAKLLLDRVDECHIN